MNESEWIEYAKIHNPPAPTPDHSETLLSDPHLRHVYEAAIAVAQQEEGASGVAFGLSMAVSGRPLDERHADLWGMEERIGYALGLQMIWSVTGGGGSEIHGLDVEDVFGDESVEQWLTKWRDSLSHKASEAGGSDA